MNYPAHFIETYLLKYGLTSYCPRLNWNRNCTTMRHFYNLALALFIFTCSNSLFAQQAESQDDEMLVNPVSVVREVGLYKGINSLPESVRRSKAFARSLHDLEHFAGFDGVY